MILDKKHKKNFSKWWHYCSNCKNIKILKLFRRNCEKCKSKNTVFYVNYNGYVFPELTNKSNLKVFEND